MSFFFGKKTKVKPEYTSMQGQTSTSVLPVPLVWGENRIAPNLLWYGDFTAVKQKQKTGKGFSPSVTSYTYSASVIQGLCQGEIAGVGRAWKDQDRKASYTELGLTLFTGTYPQAPWGYLTTNHPTQALGYNGTAYVAAANYDLGSANTLGNHSYEVQGRAYNSQIDGNGDADVAVVIFDLLCNPYYGALFPSAFVDQDQLFSSPAAPTTGDACLQTYCRANGYGMSPALSSQEQASAILDRWTKIFNTAIVWTGYTLKFIPYSSQTVVDHGVAFVPDLTVRYTIINGYFITGENDDPVILTRGDPADAFNSRSLEVVDKENEYNAVPVTWKDQALIDLYGLREGSTFIAHEITDPTMATELVAIMGQREAWIRNEATLTVPPSFDRLEPMDIVTIIDRNVGVFSCRVKEIEEQDDNNLALTLEEYPEGTSSAPRGTTQPVVNTPQNTGVPAEAINPPIIFEPRSDMSEGVPQVWAAVSGGDGTTADPNWGGCYVWLSTDGGVVYQNIGQIDSPARMGKLTAGLASYGAANPDTVNTLAVDLAMSDGVLEGVTSAEAADAVTVSIVTDGSTHEILSYMDATLTGPDQYDLDGELYRGLYGTTGAAWSTGDDFARLDDNIFKFNLPTFYIGGSLWLKFQSYNIFGIGAGLQDLSSCTPYPYTPVGTGYGEGTGGVPGEPIITTAVPSGPQQISVQWDANPLTDHVTTYTVYRGTGAAVPFGSTTPIATVAGQYFLDATVDPDEDYTYYVVANNVVGSGDPSLPETVTSGSTGVAIVRLYGSLDRKPNDAEELFDIEMRGDEVFEAGLPQNIGSVDVAADADAEFPIYVNGVQVGNATVLAGTTDMVWTMASTYTAAPGDRLKFEAPSPQDADLSGPAYTFNGRR